MKWKVMIQHAHDVDIDHARALFDHLFAGDMPRAFDVRFWDGTLWPAEATESRFTLRLNHAGALRHMFAQANDLALGEAYIHGDFDIEGDLEAVFPIGDRLVEKSFSLGEKLRLFWDLHRLPRRDGRNDGRGPAHLRGRQHAEERDRQAIRYHYDVSNAFYQLFLDERMVYSCAYFAAVDEAIDQAQARKLDYLCRKLRLTPGERLLDIGCGWGALVIHAAKHFGITALGVTLSEKQADLANKRIEAAGLGDRCEVRIEDYRRVGPNESFDKAVSVGMVEHVGEAQLPTYFEQVHRLLKPGGVFLNHGITRSAWIEPPRRPNFIHAYVFPDGDLMPIHTRLRHAEQAGFEVRDVEDLREHYALTLRQWVRRLRDQTEKAHELVDDVTYRIWELFMAGSAYNFDAANLNLYQELLSKPDAAGRSHLPLTRADWYARGA